MSLNETIFWALPYNVRQKIYQIVRKDKFNKQVAKNQGETREGYSFTKFHEYKCIYVHIPKCGGISISNTLFGNLGGGHLPLKHFQLLFTTDQFESYFKFAIVRNPWDRLVSAYLFLKKGGINEKDRVWAEQNLGEYKTFEEFVKNWMVQKHALKQLHFKPQVEYIYDNRNNLLTDFLGRFENFENSYKEILFRLGLPYTPVKNENINKTRRDYTKYYSAETAEIVEKVYKKDIELLGYKFLQP